MTLTNKTLNKTLESLRICANEAQRTAIIERFTVEPEPYEWSEQDIFTQIQNFLGCGEFVKSIHNNSYQSDLLLEMEF